MEVSEKDKTTEEQNSNNKLVDVDEYIIHVGEFGKRQIILQIMLFPIVLLTTYQLFLLVFVGNNPAWKCTGLNPECNNTGQAFDIGHEYYDHRCKLNNRSSWQFVRPKKFSIVTEWDLVCKKREFSYFASSAYYLGGMAGTFGIGHLCDRFAIFLVYFGISFAIDDLGGSMYRDFILAGAIEFPAGVLSIIFANRSQGLCLLTVVGTLGSFCALMQAFAVVRHFHAIAPYVVMGVTAIISTALCFLLSETNGEPTKEVSRLNERDNVLDVEMPPVIANCLVDDTEVERKAQ
eukprot:gene1331-biopygen1059